MPAYYNEIDKYAAQWLRNLISAGHIAPGDVDERSIAAVSASDLAGYTQCHFFAGIGIWSAALRQAGWDDARPVWTGSCPCQPLSAAGKGLGTADERHLWPEWFRLIRELRPVAILGEQVASADGLAWLDIVQSDLEDAGYASGAVDLCAAGVGAPHIRQRLWFVAYAERAERWPHNELNQQARGREQAAGGTCGLSSSGLRMADDQRQRCEIAPQPDGQPKRPEQPASRRADADGRGGVGELGDAECGGRQGSFAGLGEGGGAPCGERREQADELARPGPANGYWRDAEWIACTDGKARPVEAGTFPLAHGDFARVGRLRAYGNAICAPVAAEFIRAAMMEMAP